MRKGAALQQFFADLTEAVNSAVPTLPRRARTFAEGVWVRLYAPLDVWGKVTQWRMA